jgi:hypothetical protein
LSTPEPWLAQGDRPEKNFENREILNLGWVYQKRKKLARTGGKDVTKKVGRHFAA